MHWQSPDIDGACLSFMSWKNYHKDRKDQEVRIDQLIKPLFSIENVLNYCNEQKEQNKNGSHPNGHFSLVHSKLLQITNKIKAVEKQDGNTHKQDNVCLAEFYTRE